MGVDMNSKVCLLLTLCPCLLGSEIVESRGRQTIEDGPYGGNGGSPWTDGGGVHLNGLISEIELRTGSEVDSIRAKYGDVWGDTHGGGGGDAHTFQINPGAKIVIVQGRSGSRLDELEL